MEETMENGLVRCKEWHARLICDEPAARSNDFGMSLRLLKHQASRHFILHPEDSVGLVLFACVGALHGTIDPLHFAKLCLPMVEVTRLTTPQRADEEEQFSILLYIQLDPLAK